MQQTVVNGVWMWSRWEGERNLHAGSYFIEHAEGNCVIDPIDASIEDLRQMDERGGVAWVIVTSRDHLRASVSFLEHFRAKLAVGAGDAAEFGLPVDRELHDGETFLGWFVLSLDGFKTAGEIALYSWSRRAAVVGAALRGDPAGSLRFLADTVLSDAIRAVLSMRRLRALNDVERILLTDGTPIFNGGAAALGDCIDARHLPSALRINVDDVPMHRDIGPGNYAVDRGEVGRLLGARKLGYQLVKLESGSSFCPMHWHTAEEELFIIWEGDPRLLTPRGKVRLRAGDVVAFPVGEIGAHKILNDGPQTCTILMISNTDDDDVCFYPDSMKLMVEAVGLIVRSEPALDYFDGE